MFEVEQKKGAKGDKKKKKIEENQGKEYFRGLDSLLCGLVDFREKKIISRGID